MVKTKASEAIESITRCQFGGGSMPKPPAPPPPPPEPGQAAKNVRVKNQSKYRSGRQDTILGGSLGGASNASAQKTLLGG